MSKCRFFHFGRVSLISPQCFELSITFLSQKIENFLLYRSLFRTFVLEAYLNLKKWIFWGRVSKIMGWAGHDSTIRGSEKISSIFLITDSDRAWKTASNGICFILIADGYDIQFFWLNCMVYDDIYITILIFHPLLRRNDLFRWGNKILISDFFLVARLYIEKMKFDNILRVLPHSSSQIYIDFFLAWFNIASLVALIELYKNIYLVLF
jgi:hypothetical protein